MNLITPSYHNFKDEEDDAMGSTGGEHALQVSKRRGKRKYDDTRSGRGAKVPPIDEVSTNCLLSG